MPDSALKGFSKDIQTISVNPHLIYWMHAMEKFTVYQNETDYC